MKYDIILIIDKMIYKMYILEIFKNGKVDFEMFLKFYLWILFYDLVKFVVFLDFLIICDLVK